MNVDRLDRMIKGWFVGDFEPTCYRTTEVEIAVKQYAPGAHEPRHHHKLATELTVIIAGRALMREREIGPGAIVTMAPGEASDFTALTEVTLVAVKVPGARADKYEGNA